MKRELLSFGLLIVGTPLFAQAPTSAAPYLMLHRGWDDATAHQFWHQDQGSEILPRDWFFKLKYIDPVTKKVVVDQNTGNPVPFASVLDKFGFVPDAATPQATPYIGLAIHVDKKGTEWMGLTCAACHTGQWNYGDSKIIVEGAPSMLDFDSFFAALVDSLEAAPQADTASISYLDLKNRMERRQRINHTTLAAGFGRVDAFGQIFNQVSIVINGNSDSTKGEPNAPASYPFLWDIAQHKFVQWNGSAPNFGVEGDGSKLRNIGEVIGVFGDVSGKPEKVPKFESSINYEGIKNIEHWVSNLRSPEWPSDILGKPGDPAPGEGLYRKYCESCHAIIKDRPQYPLPVQMVPVSDVGTDPALIRNFAVVANTNKVQGKFVLIDSQHPSRKFGASAPIGEIAGYYSVGVLRGLESTTFIDPGNLVRSLTDFFQSREAGPAAVNSYKARPLDGIWATAPYLHNGSIPNLWELLQEPGKRAATFCVGDKRFDPVQVGYHSVSGGVASCEGSFRFDTALPGNRNTGHSYGTAEMSDDEKRSLIEYLKSL